MWARNKRQNECYTASVKYNKRAYTFFASLLFSLSLSFFQRSRKRYRMPKPWNRPEGFGLEATKILESQTSSDAALTLSLSFPSFSSLFSVVFFFHLTMHSILSFRTSTNYNTGLLRSRKEPGFIAKSNRRAEIRNITSRSALIIRNSVGFVSLRCTCVGDRFFANWQNN